MNNKFFFILLIFLFVSCKHTEEKAIEVVSLTDNLTGKAVLNDLFDEFEFISLETTNESIFGRIKKLIIFDNKYYIHDSQLKKIFVFQMDGTFIQTIGNIGNGPGEYNHLEDFIIDEENNRIIILGFPSKVYIYDLYGKFIQQKTFMSLPVWSICSYKNGYICSNNHQSFSQNNTSLIYLLDKDFNIKNSVCNTSINNELPFFVSHPFFKDGNNIYYFDNINSRLYKIDTENPEKLEYYSFVFTSPIPLDVISDPQKFIENQGDYCFFNNAYLLNNLFWASFVNKGNLCVIVKDLKSNKQFTAKYSDWYPSILSNHNGFFYSAIYADFIIEGDAIIPNAKWTTKYPVDLDSNPIILRFKPKDVLK